MSGRLLPFRRPGPFGAAPAGLLPAALLLAAALAVTGCGSAAGPAAPGTTTAGPGTGGHSPGTTARADRTLCADPGKVIWAEAVKLPSLSALQGQPFRRVFRVAISDPSRARTLAEAICALPAMPKGAFHCPIDYLGSFRLTLRTAARRFGPVTIEASGCAKVTGAGPLRWAARTPAFWQILSRTTGIPAPARLLPPTRGSEPPIVAGPARG